MNKRMHKKAVKRDFQGWQSFFDEYYPWLLKQPANTFDVGMRHNLRCYIIELEQRRLARKGNSKRVAKCHGEEQEGTSND